MIYGKPELTKDMGAKRFLEFFYNDGELISFCQKNGIDSTGGRMELVERIATFLNDGKSVSNEFVVKPEVDLSIINGDTLIETDFSMSERHERFFMAATDGEFVPYDDFIIWLEENPGKSYAEAVALWYLLRDDIEAM